MFCRNCGSEIPDDTKFCPNCGVATQSEQIKSEIPPQQTLCSQMSHDPENTRSKTKVVKPIYKRWWFWLIVVLVVIGAFGRRTGGDNAADSASSTKSTTISTQIGDVEESSTNTTITATATPTATETPQPTAYHVGDVLDTSSLKITYLACGTYNESNEFLQPAEGNKYVFIELFCENNSKSDSSISFYNFNCYADGYACNPYYGNEDELSATLSVGRSTTGKVVFEVPVDAEEIEFEYDYNLLSNKKATFIYEGDVDSGIVPEITVGASTDTYNVGDVVDTGTLMISYVECGEYYSDNEFIVPADGNRFIYCRFEVENTSSSDQYISTFSFDCYADGKSCEPNFVLEDNLDATISSGRKASGIVSFEVPEDAEIIEVEYLDNVWTSKRIVFTYSD